MNGLSRRRIAQAICRYGVRIAPPHRKALAEAMLAECDYVSDADALGFAAGCFISIAGWWLATAHGVNQSARLAVSAGAGAFALLALVVARSGLGQWQPNRGLGACADHGLLCCCGLYRIKGRFARRGATYLSWPRA